MLRGLIALLLLGNLAFFAWTLGWLDPLFGPARAEREPQRLAAQVRPEQVQIQRTAASPGAAASPAARPASGPASAPSAAPATAVSAVTGASAPGNGKGGAAATSGPIPVPMAAASRVPAVATASAPSPVATTRPTPTPVAVPEPTPTPVPAPVPPRPVASAPTATAVTPDTPVTAAPTVAAPSAPAASRLAPAVASVCLEAGPFDGAELAAAEADMRSALPGGGWGARKAQLNGEWMIYMGPYPDRETIDRKKAELGRIRGGITQEELVAPSPLAGGLSLGRFASPGAANATLAQYRLRGIRTARVVQSAVGTPVTYVRVAQADAATAARLSDLKLGPSGRAFSACPR